MHIVVAVVLVACVAYFARFPFMATSVIARSRYFVAPVLGADRHKGQAGKLHAMSM
jgi:hypothetical protein